MHAVTLSPKNEDFWAGLGVLWPPNLGTFECVENSIMVVVVVMKMINYGSGHSID